ERRRTHLIPGVQQVMQVVRVVRAKFAVHLHEVEAPDPGGKRLSQSDRGNADRRSRQNEIANAVALLKQQQNGSANRKFAPVGAPEAEQDDQVGGRSQRHPEELVERVDGTLLVTECKQGCEYDRRKRRPVESWDGHPQQRFAVSGEVKRVQQRDAHSYVDCSQPDGTVKLGGILDPEVPYEIQADPEGEPAPIEEETCPAVSVAVPDARRDAAQERNSRQNQRSREAHDLLSGARQSGKMKKHQQENPHVDEPETSRDLGVHKRASSAISFVKELGQKNDGEQSAENQASPAA